MFGRNVFLNIVSGIIGSGLGGTLADPVRNYPAYFSRGTILDKFPYLLPNLVCACLVVMSMIVGILFLEETHEDKRDRNDPGLMAGDWILGLFRSNDISEKGGFIEESFHLLTEAVDGQHSDYSSTETSPALCPVPMGMVELPAQIMQLKEQSMHVSKQQMGLSGAFTNQVVLIIVSYGVLA